VLGLYIQNLKS